MDFGFIELTVDRLIWTFILKRILKPINSFLTIIRFILIDEYEDK